VGDTGGDKNLLEFRILFYFVSLRCVGAVFTTRMWIR